ncbi:MAG: hypothetical protein DMF70_04570, partial [Acidobacteria bacterium]
MRKPRPIGGKVTIIAGLLIAAAVTTVTSSRLHRSANLVKSTPEVAATTPVEPLTQHCLPQITVHDYSRVSCDIDVAAETLHVKRGEFGDWRDGMKFRNLSFGDVTGDREEEAIVTFAVETDGNMRPDVVYVFTLSNQSPKLIYAFESGDRAQGGLRKVYAKDHRLIVELWGSGNTLEETSFSDGGNGLCCPHFFTRSR